MDLRTKIIIALVGLLLTLAAIVALTVPEVGRAIATVLTFVAAGLAGAEAEKVRRDRESPESEPVTVSDDFDQEIEEQTTEQQTATGDDLASQLNEQTEPYVD